MSQERPQKRPAFEPPALLVQPVAGDPHMKRPAATVAGSVLVILRVLSGVLWLLALTISWNDFADSLDLSVDGVPPDPADLIWLLGVLWVLVGVGLLVELGLAVLILRGYNAPRVIVMVFSTFSIGSAFALWWAQEQEIHVGATLLNVAFDILVLLALSSRCAAAYARRNERR